MKIILNIALGLALLLLLPASLVGQSWPLLPDKYFLWGNSSNKEGNLWDQAWRVAVNPNGDKVFVAGEEETTNGGSAFAVKAYRATDGKLLWKKSYNREGTGWDGAFTVTADNNYVYVAGETVTTSGGVGFSVRAYKAKDGKLVWENYYDREGALLDGAWKVVLYNGVLYVTGESETAAGGTAMTVRAYNADTGSLLWSDNYD
ncbi:MAG: PQQ-binding-like beta-propeller repeat protein, partial [Candidatus Brocadiales bacterium]